MTKHAHNDLNDKEYATYLATHNLTDTEDVASQFQKLINLAKYNKSAEKKDAIHKKHFLNDLNHEEYYSYLIIEKMTPVEILASQFQKLVDLADYNKLTLEDKKYTFPPKTKQFDTEQLIKRFNDFCKQIKDFLQVAKIKNEIAKKTADERLRENKRIHRMSKALETISILINLSYSNISDSMINFSDINVAARKKADKKELAFWSSYLASPRPHKADSQTYKGYPESPFDSQRKRQINNNNLPKLENLDDELSFSDEKDDLELHSDIQQPSSYLEPFAVPVNNQIEQKISIPLQTNSPIKADMQQPSGYLEPFAAPAVNNEMEQKASTPLQTDSPIKIEPISNANQTTARKVDLLSPKTKQATNAVVINQFDTPNKKRTVYEYSDGTSKIIANPPTPVKAMAPPPPPPVAPPVAQIKSSALSVVPIKSINIIGNNEQVKLTSSNLVVVYSSNNQITLKYLDPNDNSEKSIAITYNLTNAEKQQLNDIKLNEKIITRSSKKKTATEISESTKLKDQLFDKIKTFYSEQKKTVGKPANQASALMGELASAINKPRTKTNIQPKVQNKENNNAENAENQAPFWARNTNKFVSPTKIKNLDDKLQTKVTSPLTLISLFNPNRLKNIGNNNNNIVTNKPALAPEPAAFGVHMLKNTGNRFIGKETTVASTENNNQSLPSKPDQPGNEMKL